MPYDSAAQRGFMHANHPGIASRWDKEEHDAKRRKRASNVGKRLSGGSFDSGPSTVVRGAPRARVRRNTTLARYAGTPGHGKRYGPEPGLEVYRGGSRVAKFDATSVLSRAGKLGQKLDTGMKTVQSAATAGRVGADPAKLVQPTTRGGKALVATGQKLGQATSTPMRAATTGGAIGAAGTVAAQTAMPGQKDPNGVGKADRQSGVMVTRMHGSSPRNHDPEAHRQRRLGAYQGVANTAGAAGLAAGAYEHRRINSKTKAVLRGNPATSVRNATILSRRTAGKIGGGLAALAAGEKIRRHANDPRNRAWR